MLRFPLALACVLMSLGIPQAQQPQTPDEVLARAISLVEICPSTTIITDLETGLVISPTAEDMAVGRKTDPRKIFRPGRFRISMEGEFVVNGRDTYTLKFAPWPEEKQLKALPGENERAERAINHVGGTIQVDKITGNIVTVHGSLPAKLKYKGGLGAVYTLVFNAKQEWKNGRWALSKADLTYHYRKLFGTTHKEYKTRFDCQ